MKPIIAILLTTAALSAAPVLLKSTKVNNLNPDLSKRKAALVSIIGNEGKPTQIDVQLKLSEEENSYNVKYKITSVTTDSCGVVSYKGSLIKNGPSIPEEHFTAEFIDYTNETCFIYRAFLSQFRIIFRDDLKGTSETENFYGNPRHKPVNDDNSDSSKMKPVTPEDACKIYTSSWSSELKRCRCVHPYLARYNRWTEKCEFRSGVPGLP